MMMILIVLTVIIGVSVATVASAQALARARRGTDPDLSRQLDDLSDTIARLRDDIEAIASKHDADYQMLEERLDFTERMLTRAKERAQD